MILDVLTKAGIPVLAYGNFISIAINFAIRAFIIFMMVKPINRWRRNTPYPLTPPTARAEDVFLLREICGSLKTLTFRF
jgi:large conductance mechanosensitive channel